ncbi:hypothetical protein [Klenkia soli]|uniref:hypothetical protein n=1 Tax=Klenkia soli TaxID=1052260 RepID=UPI000B86D5B1|nr:hypothetical protein [Klenkia soli]
MTAMLGLAAPHLDEVGATPERPQAFRWEQDMIAPLVGSIAQLGSPDVTGARHVLTEVPTVSGVPDIVMAELNETAVAARRSAGLRPVVDYSQVRTLLVVADGFRTVTAMSGATGLSVGHLRGNVLPALATLGWVTPVRGRGAAAQVDAVHVLQPLGDELVTVEAKKSAWQRAVHQAMRHTGSADSSYIALDAARADVAVEQRAAIAGLGVGVLLVDSPTGQVQVAARPRAHVPDRAAHAVLAERVWQLVLNGQTAGPSYPVFGRTLHAV